MLASRGTGGEARPSQRASMRLLELSPARLPGALVVRQLPREGRGPRLVGDKERGGQKEEEEKEAQEEGEQAGLRTGAEAFQLPGELRKLYQSFPKCQDSLYVKIQS